MPIDYAIHVTVGLVVFAAIGLVVVAARNRGRPSTIVALVGLLIIGLVATPLVRPERFRDPREDLVVTEGPNGPITEVEVIGLCLSVSRQVGPLSFIVGSDLFPGDGWDRGPSSACDASGHIGVIDLPGSVRSGEWMLCDYAFCHELTREP